MYLVSSIDRVHGADAEASAPNNTKLRTQIFTLEGKHPTSGKRPTKISQRQGVERKTCDSRTRDTKAGERENDTT